MHVTEHEEVFRFEVPVDDECVVRVFERESELRSKTKCGSEAEDSLPLEDFAEWRPIEVFHQDARSPLGRLDVGKDLDNVWVLELTPDLVLAPEASDRDGIVHEVGVEELERDATVTIDIPRLIHTPHRAVSDNRRELVTFDERTDTRIRKRTILADLEEERAIDLAKRSVSQNESATWASTQHGRMSLFDLPKTCDP